MAKVFIDVGGYHGESVRAALDPRFGFDRVYCFEPVRACYEHITKNVRDPRLQAINAGLLDRTATLPIYQAGSLGGSVYEDAPKMGDASGPEIGSFLNSSEFFKKNISSNDRVWTKLNCEGAECDIMIDLMESGEANKLTEVLLDLDAAKIPSARQKLAKLRSMLLDPPFSYHYPEEVQYEMVTNFGGIRNWLIVTGAMENDFRIFLRSVVYQSGCAIDPKINGYYKIRLLRFLRLRRPPSVPTKPGSAIPRGRTVR